MQFTDRLTLDGVRRTGDGYLVATPKVARTGIQVYAGYEVDPQDIHGLRDKATVNVYRPEDEVFHADALKSYAHRPVTNDHPPVMVDASNWKQYAIGQTGDEIARDGDSIRVPLVLMDEAAINDVEGGKRELSMGYSAELVFGDGVTPEGQPYQVKQTNLRMNHLAVVTAARGGSTLKIGDNDMKGNRSMSNRTIQVDGLPVELADKDAAIVEKELNKLKEQVAAKEEELAEAKKASDAKDAQMAAKDAEIDALKGEVLDAAALDARVAARAELIAVAKDIAPDVKTAGLSDADIRKAVVVSKIGDEAMKDKPEAYIDARFDILADTAKKTTDSNNALRGAIAGIKIDASDSLSAEKTAHQAMIDRLNRKKSA
ncbi:DUF2213 domain-containing protein [Bartonella sp. LJL80]